MNTTTDIDAQWRARALYLLSIARWIEPSAGNVPDAVIKAPMESWRAAAVSAWLNRVVAGRFGNSVGDRTDDPAMADHILGQAKIAAGKKKPALEAVRLAEIAFDVKACESGALKIYSRYSMDFDCWLVTHQSVELLRTLADMAQWFPGDPLSADLMLDALSAELLEADLHM
ncbi:hypothetical protein [Mycolicibacterium septicum]|uniref:hypothetical protein n=1 Tax=Mycolicibacterium septicum TaxID=98668 RepID=UPI001AF3AA41|nr:hypothetical protein [Mycolicibacterium septicum]QRY53386.1 hypothetical protein JVX95_08735 [Mycolicibacterium septicum]